MYSTQKPIEKPLYLGIAVLVAGGGRGVVALNTYRFTSKAPVCLKFMLFNYTALFQVHYTTIMYRREAGEKR